jgi:hypothetical protein
MVIAPDRRAERTAPVQRKNRNLQARVITIGSPAMLRSTIGFVS